MVQNFNNLTLEENPKSKKKNTSTGILWARSVTRKKHMVRILNLDLGRSGFDTLTFFFRLQQLKNNHKQNITKHVTTKSTPVFGVTKKYE